MPFPLVDIDEPVPAPAPTPAPRGRSLPLIDIDDPAPAPPPRNPTPGVTTRDPGSRLLGLLSGPSITTYEGPNVLPARPPNPLRQIPGRNTAPHPPAPVPDKGLLGEVGDKIANSANLSGRGLISLWDEVNQGLEGIAPGITGQAGQDSHDIAAKASQAVQEAVAQRDAEGGHHPVVAGIAGAAADLAPALLGPAGLATFAGEAAGNRRQDVLEQGGSEGKADTAGAADAILNLLLPAIGRVAGPVAGPAARAVERATGSARAAGAVTGAAEGGTAVAGLGTGEAGISAATGDTERAQKEIGGGEDVAGFSAMSAILGLLTGRHGGHGLPPTEVQRLEKLWAPHESAPVDQAITPPTEAAGTPGPVEGAEHLPFRPTPPADVSAQPDGPEPVRGSNVGALARMEPGSLETQEAPPVPDSSATTKPEATPAQAIVKEASNGLAQEAAAQEAPHGPVEGTPEGRSDPQSQDGLARVAPEAAPRGTDAAHLSPDAQAEVARMAANEPDVLAHPLVRDTIEERRGANDAAGDLGNVQQAAIGARAKIERAARIAKVTDDRKARDAQSPAPPERPEGGAAPTPEAKAEADKAGVTIDRSHDIPLVGGISQDGKTVYVDKHAPQKMTMPDGKVADVDASLVKHETAEKPAIDANTAAGHEPVKAYEDAHNNTAVPAEDALLKSKGIEPDHFNDALKPHVEAIAERNRTAMEQGKPQNLAPDLQAEHVAAGAKEGLNPPARSDIMTKEDFRAEQNPPDPLGDAIKHQRAQDEVAPREPLPDRSPPAPSSGVAPGERANKRPDLATPGLDPRQRDAYEAQRNAAGDPEVRSREKVRQEAALQVRADPDAELHRLLGAAEEGIQSDFNNASAQFLLDHLYEQGRTEDHAKLALAYLKNGSDWARAGGMRADRVSTPQGRLSEARTIVAPGRTEALKEVAALKAVVDQHQVERDRLQATIDQLQRDAATRTPSPTRAKVAGASKAARQQFKDTLSKWTKAFSTGAGPTRGSFDLGLSQAAWELVRDGSKAGLLTFAELALAVTDHVRAFRHDPEAHKALEQAWDEAAGKDSELPAREGGVAEAQDADPRHSLETRIEQKQKRLAGLVTYKAKLERDLAAMTPEQRMAYLEGEAARKEMPPELRKVVEDGQAEIRAIEKRIKALDAQEEKAGKPEPTAMEKAQQRLKAEEERLASAERALTKRKADLAGMTTKDRAAFLAKEKADGKPPAEIQARRDASQAKRDIIRKEIAKLEADAGFAKGKARVLRTKEEKEAKKLAAIEKRMAEREAKLAAMDPAARGAELARERAAGATPAGLQKLRDASAARLKVIRDRVKALESTAEGATTRIPERKLLQGRIDEIRRRTADTKDRYQREIDRLGALSWDQRRQEAYLGKVKSPAIQGEVTARQAELKGLREELEAHRKTIRDLLARRAKLDELLDQTGKDLTEAQRKKAITDAGDKAQLKKLGYDVEAKDPAWTHDKREWANFLSAVDATTGGMPAVLRELYIGSLHMSTGVAGKKIVADAINLGLHFAIRRPLEATINTAFGGGDKNATWGEVGRVYGAMMPVLWKAIKNGAQTWKTEKTPLELQSAEDLQHFPVMRGWKGVIIRNLTLLPMVRAIDAFSRTLIAHTEVAAQAYRSAVDGDGKRLTGDDLAHHIAKETSDQGSESWKRAHDLAMRSTFTEKADGPLVRRINTAKYGEAKTAGDKAVKAAANVLFPFTTIPSNIIKQGFTQWTPILSDALAVGRAMSRDEQGKLHIDPEKATTEAAQALIRWGVTSGALWMAAAGIISGSEAEDKNKRSFNLWGKHWGYQHLGPITTALSTAADLVHGFKDGGVGGALSDAALGELHRFGETPVAKPMMDIIAAASSRDPDRWLHYAVDRLPIPSVVRQLAGASDDSVGNPGAPAVGDGRPERFVEYLKRAVGLSKTPDRMIEGVPVTREHFDSPTATFLYRLFSPMPLGREDSPEAQFKREKDASGKVLTEFNHLRSKARESGSEADADALDRFAELHQAEMDHATDMRGAEKDIKGSIRDGKRGDAGAPAAIRQKAIEALKAKRVEPAKR